MKNCVKNPNCENVLEGCNSLMMCGGLCTLCCRPVAGEDTKFQSIELQDNVWAHLFFMVYNLGFALNCIGLKKDSFSGTPIFLSYLFQMLKIIVICIGIFLVQCALVFVLLSDNLKVKSTSATTSSY